MNQTCILSSNPTLIDTHVGESEGMIADGRITEKVIQQKQGILFESDEHYLLSRVSYCGKFESNVEEKKSKSVSKDELRSLRK